MSDKAKQLAIKGLERMKGDDLYRAKLAFKNLTYEQMQKEYGRSGQSCAEIITGYEKRDAEVDEAIAWVNSQ